MQPVHLLTHPTAGLALLFHRVHELTRSFSTESMSTSYGAASFTDLFAILPIVSSQSISFKEPDKPSIAPLPGDPVKRLQQCEAECQVLLL